MLQTHSEEKRVRGCPANGGMGACRLGQDEQYFTVREILAEASTASDAALSHERSTFCRFGFATLGLRLFKFGKEFVPL
jgi:hypothetical protein